ncbi:MAG: site-specific DNA-methyltransferase [Phycisphaerales bacterium]
MGRIIQGENLSVLRALPDASVQLIYIDPPFNTGSPRRHQRIRTTRDDKGDRTGFGGRRYRSEVVSDIRYDDDFDDLPEYLEPRLREAHRILSESGSFFLHIDYRESHYCKVLLDQIFGRDRFQNEIIWAYDYGARSKKRWSPKHDAILWYTRHPTKYTFNFDAMDRIPYMAPGLVTPEKAARGKTPTDVWWHTIVSPNGAERTGYPTQKPLGVLRRVVAVHSNPGDTVLDFFAGSGTAGAAAAELDRDYILIDNHPDAITVMTERLASTNPAIETHEPK